MSVDPVKASRVLDLLEVATRNGDLGKDEASSILSSWLADQKRSSRSGSSQSLPRIHSWTAALNSTSTPPTPMPTPPMTPPPLPPRRRWRTTVKPSWRPIWWRRWLAACVTSGAAADANADADADADATLRPQTPPPMPPLPPPPPPGHEYALYGGPAPAFPAQRQSTPSVTSDDIYEYEDCWLPAVAVEDDAAPGRESTQSMIAAAAAAQSNTTDSGVFSC